MNFLPNSIYPTTSGKIRIRKNFENYFISDKKIKKNITANRDLVEILKLCNGQKSISDIIFNISKEKVCGDLSERITESLLKLKKDELICFKKEKSNVSLILREYNYKFPLDFVYLEPTRRCNFQCIHCYASSPSITKASKSIHEMGTKEYFQLIDELDKAGVMAICFTGGEPFIREDIFDILKYVDSKNMEIGILTNGSILNEDKIEKLKEINPKFIRISFDSHKKEAFEKIRGKGTYSSVLKNIRKMHEARLPVEINSILFKGINDSYQDIKGLLSFLKNEGIPPENITFDEFMLEGEGKNKQHYQINRKKTIQNIKKAFKKIFSDFEFVKKKDASFWNKYEGKGNFSGNFCGIGEETCYITAHGDITLCPALSTDEYKAGNVRKKNIKEIWENSEMFDYFRKKKYFENSECTSCGWLERCFGGCKAKSMTCFGRFNAPDLWLCTYFEVFR